MRPTCLLCPGIFVFRLDFPGEHDTTERAVSDLHDSEYSVGTAAASERTGPPALPHLLPDPLIV